MLGLQEAMKIAQKEYPHYSIGEIVDIGGSWAFGFDSGEPTIPGIPYITVNKSSGRIGRLSIPPIENLDILDNGTIIKA